jgi:hypothetical protein
MGLHDRLSHHVAQGVAFAFGEQAKRFGQGQTYLMAVCIAFSLLFPRIRA